MFVPKTGGLMELVTFLAIAFLSSTASYVAGQKGRSPAGWFFASLISALLVWYWVSILWSPAVSVVAIMMLLLLPSRWTTESQDQLAAANEGYSVDYRKCPYCAEAVRKEAIKCRHCQSDISDSKLA